MIDNYGRWTPEEDYSTYPREKWCDMDRVAAITCFANKQSKRVIDPAIFMA